MKEAHIGEPTWEKNWRSYEQTSMERPKSEAIERYEALPPSAKIYLNLGYSSRNPQLTPDAVSDLKSQQLTIQMNMRLEAPEEWAQCVGFITFMENRRTGKEVPS